MQILHEDNHLLVINKPSGWIVQGAQSGHPSVIDWASEYLGTKYNKPGKVFVGVVSRLDGPVSGVLPLARTSKSASRLSQQFRDHKPQKTYWVIVAKSPPSESGRLENWLVRRESDFVTRVVDRETVDSKLSILEYRQLGQNERGVQLEVRLITGRKHQIRAQLSAIGSPILGDTRYGSTQSFATGIALHCRSLQIQHPTLKNDLHFEASLPKYWPWRYQSI